MGVASIDFVTKSFTDNMKDVRRDTDQTTKYALRAVGRLLGKKARAYAPVYKGNDPRAAAESGQLKKSIKNAKIMHVEGRDYVLKVGPAGSKKKGTTVHRLLPTTEAGIARSQNKGKKAGSVRGVPLYRAQQEATYGYMRKGFADGQAEFTRVYEEALAKAFAKYKG